MDNIFTEGIGGHKRQDAHVSVNPYAGPYNSVAEANAAIPYAVRKKGLQCIIYQEYIGIPNVPVVYWYFAGVEDSNLVVMPYVANGNNIEYLMAVTIDDGIISGGVTWLSGLTYQVSALVFYLNGQTRTAPPTQVTLADGDATYSRIDVILVRGDGEVSVLEGTPSATPAKPVFDSFVYQEVTFITVPSGATAPNVTEVVIYKEDLQESGGEWDSGYYQTSNIDTDNTVSPNVGSKSIYVGVPVGSSYLYLKHSTGVLLSSIDQLSFWLKIETVTAPIMGVRIVDENDSVSGYATITNGQYGVDASIIGYQLVTIPITAFSVPGSYCKEIRFSFFASGSGNFTGYIDDIRFLGGASAPVLPVNTFLSLPDTPESYTGNARKLLWVNQNENGLEFCDNIELQDSILFKVLTAAQFLMQNGANIEMSGGEITTALNSAINLGNNSVLKLSDNYSVFGNNTLKFIVSENFDGSTPFLQINPSYAIMKLLSTSYSISGSTGQFWIGENIYNTDGVYIQRSGAIISITTSGGLKISSNGSTSQIIVGENIYNTDGVYIQRNGTIVDISTSGTHPHIYISANGTELKLDENGLKVQIQGAGAYYLPNTVGTEGKIIQMGADNKMEFVDMPEVDANISIQDANGIEQFSGSNIKFSGFTFDAATKKVINISLKYNTIFLSKNIGNDATAEPNNSAKPFYTINAAVLWLLSHIDRGFNWYIETLDNSEYNYTLNMNVQTINSLKGFNIINNSGATISIENYFDATEQEIFKFTSGTLRYRKTDNTTIFSATLSEAKRKIFQHDVKNVVFDNTQATPSLIDRGYYRNGGHDSPFNYINWENLTIENYGEKICDNYEPNFKVNIGTITYNGTGGRALNIFATYGTSCNVLNIGIIINNTATKTTLVSNILNVNGNYTLCTINSKEINLLKNVTFNDVILTQNIAGTPRILKGNGNFLTLDFSSDTTFLNNALTARNILDGYDYNSYYLFQNINFIVTATSALTRLFLNDLRSGRYSTQIILDNITFKSLKSSCVILQIGNGYAQTDAVYQILFRNNIIILNNYYLVGGSVETGASQNALISQGANIYHDYGFICADVDFQTTIPNINTY